MSCYLGSFISFQIVCTCSKLRFGSFIPQFCATIISTCNHKYHMKDAKVITAIMDSIYINEFIEQIQKEHEEEKMSMTQETIDD